MWDISNDDAPNIAEDVSEIENRTAEHVAQSLFSGLLSSSFACGGTIEFSESDVLPSQAPDGIVVPPPSPTNDRGLITIRWDSTTLIEKLVLPLSLDDMSKEPSPVAKLVASTQPASFGFQGQDVIDESYRKASKLDTSAFSTNFCPYESGIIDTIGQALLPEVSSSSQSIRAELYKLNIYQAPSGFFKAHVDTPRSELQFGSLVVCLPCEHQGGQLVVRHQGQVQTFDWSGSSKDIKWAAFYSDCEHEVLEVTSGHRITLTYNLYMRHSLGDTRRNRAFDLEQLPAYQLVKEALAKPDFMPNGGTLGKYCSHAYAHATKNAASAFPSILKGSDMVAHEIFRSLGIEVLIRPVADHIRKHLDDDASEFEDNPELLTHDHIGDELGALYNTGCDWGGNGGSVVEVYKYYPNTLMRVTWMNRPKDGTENVQFAFTRYGNQAEADWEYSFCALLFEIPSYPKRIELAKELDYTL